MASFNLTPSSVSSFTLNGIPGLEAAHIWISIPFCIFYVISLLVNFMVLFVISKSLTLHKPMYLLIFMLALTDVAGPTCVIPKALFIFWFGFKDITVDGCLTQIFFLQTTTAVHSAILVTMAFDRYVAICHPLRYASILTNAKITKLGLVGLIRAVLLILPAILLLRRLPFCANRVIWHTYCEYNSVLKLSCAPTTVNQMYSLGIIFITIGLDITLITLSYGLIIRAVLSFSSKNAHQKALNTCTAHICVILIAYSPSFFSALIRSLSQGIAPHIQIIVANTNILIPSMFNPIIYAVKTKELRNQVQKYLCRM